jgi:ribose transport system substrate-binding protein
MPELNLLRTESRNAHKTQMKRLKFLLSLTTASNDYQSEQAKAAEESAIRFGIDLKVVYADNDAINQSQQLISAVHEPPATRPDGILFEPVSGTGLPHVARGAVAAGIGWVVLNTDAPYIFELREKATAPIFWVSSDHLEIGRIQGRQMAAVLPHGGAVLYIQGSSEHSAATQRTTGMMEIKPDNIQLITLRAKWTEESSFRAVESWLRLSTSRKAAIGAIVAQDDSMAIGARRAFERLVDPAARAKWLSLPFLGSDGLPDTGQTWVRKGLLAATIVCPANAGQALEALARAMSKGPVTAATQPDARLLVAARPYPRVEQLALLSAATSRVRV